MKIPSPLFLYKQPVTGLVPEQSSTAPTSPADGQLWTDTSVTPRQTRRWDGSAWQPWVVLGTTAGTAADGSLVERLANKNAASGYAGLDGSSLLAFSQIPVGSSATTVARGDLVERLANKNTAGGYAGVDAGSRIAAAQLPSVITAAGQTGATTTVRFVGGTGAAAAPTAGTFSQGDVVVGTDGSVYVCTVAGTPGTWRRSLRDNELGAANGIATLNASSQVPIAQIPTGQTGTTVPLGNDARFSDNRTPIDASVTGGTAGVGVKIAANTITLANMAASTVDAAAATGSLRTLGTGAQQAVSGTDTRLSDTRTPTTGSVVDASVSASAAIAESKLALATDAAVGTGSRRTLGYSGLSAMPGIARLDQIAAPTAAVSMNSQLLSNLAAPVSANDAARLIDVQNSAAGIDSKPSVRILATTNVVIATNGLAAIDGVTPGAGDRVLLAGQTTATENGVYIAGAGAWARAADTITPNSTWFVEEGTTNHDTAWWVTNNGAITLGTTALVISQFSGGVAYTAGTGITLTAGQISISGTYAGQASITTVGTLTSGALGAGFTAVPVAQGGTGSTSAANARTALGVAQVGYAATNDGAGGRPGALTGGTPITFTHGLGTQDVIAQVRDASTNEILYLDVINASTTTVTVNSGTGVNWALSSLRIVVLPVV